MILTLLTTMLSWSEAEIANKETSTHVPEHKKTHHKHGKIKQCRSDHDIDAKSLSKYTDAGLQALIKLFEAAIERNSIRDPEDLENRLAYQKKRGGKTPCGMAYSELTMDHYSNVIEEDSAEMKRDTEAAKTELKKRGRNCRCKY